jgi:hypothetical protein
MNCLDLSVKRRQSKISVIPLLRSVVYHVLGYVKKRIG